MTVLELSRIYVMLKIGKMGFWEQKPKFLQNPLSLSELCLTAGTKKLVKVTVYNFKENSKFA